MRQRPPAPGGSHRLRGASLTPGLRLAAVRRPLGPRAACSGVCASIRALRFADVTILIAWISVWTPVLPRVSITQAVLSTSMRNCSSPTRLAAIQFRTIPWPASGLPNATRSSARAHRRWTALGDPTAHAVIETLRAEAVAKPSPFPPIRFAAGPHIIECRLGVGTAVVVVIPELLHAAHDRDPSLAWDEDPRLLARPARVRIYPARDDEDLRLGVQSHR